MRSFSTSFLLKLVDVLPDAILLNSVGNSLTAAETNIAKFGQKS